MRLIVLLFFTGCQICCFSFAQTQVIDSLKTRFHGAVQGKEKMALVQALLNEHESLHADTIARYYDIARTLLMQQYSADAALELAIVKLRLLRRRNKFEEAIALCDSCMAVYPSLSNNLAIYRKLVAVKGGVYVSQRKYKEALDLQYATLKKAEAANDDVSQIYCKISIGWIFMEMAKNRDALSWFFAAIAQSETTGFTSKNGTTYANIAAVYNEIDNNDSALLYIKKAMDYARRDMNLTVQANCCYILSDILVDKGDIAGAEKAMSEGLNVRKKTGDPNFLVSDLAQLAVFYENNGQPQKGIATSLEGIAFARTNKLASKYLLLYNALAGNYKKAGNDKMYAETLTQIIDLKDSLYNSNSAEALAQLQAKYEVQKKETLIARQRLGLLQRNLLLYGAAGVALLAIGFFAYKFHKYKQAEKTKSLLAVKTAEENERKRIAAGLHDNLGVQANAILHNSSLLSQAGSGNAAVVTNLQETAKEMLVNLRETLWAMKSADVSATELWLRVINFMKQMGRHYPLLQFKMSGEAPPNMILSSGKALNVLLSLQEAVNNAVKHAGAATITAKGMVSSSGWALSVADDGKGFDMNEAMSKIDSYGLKNIHERASASAIALQIESAPGNGTVLTFTLITP